MLSAKLLPILTQVRTLPGLNLSSDLILAANDSKLAGVSAANVNIQRDGVDASAAGRWPAGIQSATIINPDLVGEVRMILSPVDAELGRGNAQIQVQTRSGTNKITRRRSVECSKQRARSEHMGE